ncbi:MAG: hypothetical protein AAGA45_05775 [Verrucomicrobiota bacterium]
MKTLYLSLLLIALAILTGCTHKYGRSFQTSSVDQLALGRTTPAQAENLLGKPEAKNTTTKNGNKFERFAYSYAEVEAPIAGGNYFIDTLLVEFFDGKLQGYIYQRVQANDDNPLSSSQVEDMPRGSATKQDIIRILGDPTGKALNPTNLEVFEDTFGHEVWAWIAVREVGDAVEIQKVLVGFNFEGKLDSVSTSVTTRQ